MLSKAKSCSNKEDFESSIQSIAPGFYHHSSSYSHHLYVVVVSRDDLGETLKQFTDELKAIIFDGRYVDYFMEGLFVFKQSKQWNQDASDLRYMCRKFNLEPDQLQVQPRAVSEVRERPG